MNERPKQPQDTTFNGETAEPAQPNGLLSGFREFR
jgi:hypothetical protein